MKRIRELCPCADSALEGMALAMYQYQDDQRNNPGKTSVDDLVKQIKSIAHGKNNTLLQTVEAESEILARR